MLIVLTCFILFSSSIKLKHGVLHIFTPPPRHKKGNPLNAELLVKGRHGGFKGNGETLKNEEAVLKLTNEALKGDGKVLNGNGITKNVIERRQKVTSKR